MKLTYLAVFSPDHELGGYTVVVPDLPGCVTEGDSLADAIYMAQDAACGWVLGELEEGRKAPAQSSIDDIVIEEGDFVSYILLDMESYADKYGKKAVRKNCTLPAWINTMAEERGINFSQVLQEALEKILNDD